MTLFTGSFPSNTLFLGEETNILPVVRFVAFFKLRLVQGRDFVRTRYWVKMTGCYDGKGSAIITVIWGIVSVAWFVVVIVTVNIFTSYLTVKHAS